MLLDQVVASTAQSCPWDAVEGTVRHYDPMRCVIHRRQYGSDQDCIQSLQPRFQAAHGRGNLVSRVAHDGECAVEILCVLFSLAP